jgi:translocation and assembly module TamA
MHRTRTPWPAAARWLFLATLCLAIAIFAAHVMAADPLPYKVTLKPTGNAALDAALTGSSTLVSLQKSAPAGPFALVERARLDLQRFQTALHSFGYYKGSAAIVIAGHKLDNPDLPALLDAAPAQPPTPVDVTFRLGPQYKLGKVDIDGEVPLDAAAKLNLRSGQPAVASDVLAAQTRLLAAIQADGYPLAKVPIPVATLDNDRNLLNVVFHPETGPQATIGPIDLSGLKGVNESFVRRELLLHQGQPYSPQAIESARRALSNLGVFSSVRAVPAKALDAQGQLPVTFDLTEGPIHAVDLGIGYSTDLGVNFSTGWHDKNLFGNAEQLNLTATALLGGDAITRPGYNALAQFLKPDFFDRNQTLDVSVNALDQSLQAYDQIALIERLGLDRKLSTHWFGSIAIEGEQESIQQEGVRRHYDLIGLPVTLNFDDTNSKLNPTRGFRLALSVTPTHAIGPPSSNFFITQATASTYLDLSGDGRTVLALRGLVGKVFGAGVFALPPDQRFYAGGSGTVRGYRYQTLGPQFPNGEPTGGTAISAATIEMRQRILSSYGVVGFLDVGQVSANGAPFTSNWHEGVGVGARYYTSIGPIRLDIAVPVNKLPGGDSFDLYIGIGQAF